ncbi:DUF1287 domain-containing protein [Mesonia sp. MT50]|uniref:DUF1287 domain-containing protein n=1 Tax=Mesonia profundi TaxID=3070998 RepID=A0ABU0ZYH4_9FLAO|nr:DUF1287 domain-containing protein [Mesonia profundi]MDQ7916517.1 DUF1287 domain-containing protein [Mesonia profundi]
MKGIFFCILVFVSLSCFSQSETKAQQLATAAITLTAQQVTYDPSYFSMDYPNGDVPANKGVCTDVVIRAYRDLEVDLQELVHQDMKAHFDKYPNLWGLKSTDTNIDHRRVPNLMVFLKRKGTEKPISDHPKDYLPGDIVCWSLGGGKTHIGVVSDEKTTDLKRYKIVHNIGAGQVLEDVLFDYKIIGHYVY